MRKTLFVLALTGLAALASTGVADAQRRGGSGVRINTPNLSIGIGSGAYPGYYGGYRGGYGGYGYGGYGYGSSIGLGSLGIGYRPYYGGTVVSPGYYSTPSYYYSQSAPVQSYYSGPTYSQQSVMVTVLVPQPDAQVWFGDTSTNVQGMERVFQSPPLESGHNYTYTIRARWMENGAPVDRQRQVSVQPGQSVTVDFRNAG